MQTVTKEQFIKDYKTMNSKDLAKKYNVTRNTILNWAKKIGLEINPPGSQSKLIM